MWTAVRVISSFAAVAAFASGAGPSNVSSPIARVKPPVPPFFYVMQGVIGAPMVVGRAGGAFATFNCDSVDLRLRSSNIQLRFVGQNASPSITTEMRLPGSLNLIKGTGRRGWRQDLPTYGEVHYHDLYPGIDMVFGANSGLLKSEYRVQSGADPNLIRVGYIGAQRVRMNSDGALHVEIDGSTLVEDQPVAYQGDDVSRRRVPVAYVVHEDGTVGFRLDEYDRSQPLVIDPTITFSSYIGGNGIDVITGMTLDSTGNVYLAGYTDSPDFPVDGALQPRGGSVDAFVVKISAAGDRFLYATYIGGIGDDRALAIAVDGSGRAVVAGSTTSSNFPSTNGIQKTNAGGKDAFLLMLNASGSTLAFSTYFGGSGSDSANAVVLDATANIYIAGDSTSANLKVANAYQANNRGRQDAFAAKFSSAGSLLYSTYIGGAGDDKANGIAVDSSGAAYIAGETSSPDFPVKSAFQSTNGGGQDAFVVKLTTAGALVYSTYLGGTGGLAGQPESAAAVAVDSSGNAYVTGVTSSPNFPTAAPYQAAFGGGGTDAFVTKIHPAGTALVFSTYLGGIGGDSGKAISIEAAGTILVAGSTFSPDFPVLNSIQATKSGQTDGFLTRLTAAGNDVFFSSYVGASGSDSANAVSSNASGDVWIAGQTTSTDFPLAFPLQSFGSPEGNGFVMKLGIQNMPPALVSITPANGNGMTQTFQFVASDPNGGADIKQMIVVINSQFVAANACYFYFYQGMGSIALSSDDTKSWSTVPYGSSSTISNSQCSITGAGASASTSGNTFTFTVPIAFSSGFGGGKSVWVYAVDRGGLTTGWIQKGSWGVFTGSLLPPSASVSPSYGSGMSQTFQFTATDPNGYGNIKQLIISISSSLDLHNACYMTYVPGYNAVYLASDDTTTWMSMPFGSTTRVSNSQCTLNPAGASITMSGTSIVINVPIAFSNTFLGGKAVWMFVINQENLTPNWQQMGNWGIFSGPAVPPTQSITPATGTGNRQIYQFSGTDGNGAGDVKQMLLIMNATFNTVNACYINYVSGSNTVYLSSDDNSSWTPVRLGTSQMAENSYCVLSGTGGLVQSSGNTVTLTLPLSFKTSFNGQRFVWIGTTDQENMTTGWQRMAAFTVQ